MAEDNNEPRWVFLKGSVDKQSAKISEQDILKNNLQNKEVTKNKEEKG